MSVARSRSRLCPRPLLLSLAVCFAAGVSVPIVAAAIPSDAQAVPAYVDPALTDRLDGGGKANMLVYLERRADLSAAFGMNWKDRGHYVQQQLQAVAEESQRELRALLEQQGVEYQAFWIDNVVFVRDADRRLLDSLASRSASLAIAKFVDEPEVHLIEPESVAEARLPTLATSSTAISNIDHVRAPAVWDLGFTGRGITVANIDTGVLHTHEAIVNGYRGTTAPGQYNHNYNWWSPYAVTTAPVDPHNHGSHTIGTMVGNGGPDRHIGMAPGAKWMACQGFTPSSTGAGLLECGEFLLAPWNLNRQNPDPNRRPHVINNSWSDCGRSVDTWYEGVIDAWIAAGIVPVFSNGNASNCSYTRPPGLNTIGNPARYGKSFSIGSTGNDNGLYAAHSNWGPTDYPTTGLPNYPDPRGFPNIKPNVVAPGVSVLSAGKDGNDHYYLSTGTSMSAPHVAGLVALMWEAAPCLVGDYARTGTIIMQTARPVPYATGGTPAPGPGNVPNYATGWGEIDALGAVEAAMQLCGGFTIASEPQALRVCAAAPVSYGLKLLRHGAFSDAVALSVDAGLPAGAVATFSPNPVTPAVPAVTSTLTIGSTAGQPTASHRLTIKAQFGALARSTSVDLHIDGAPLAAPGLDTPAAGDTNVVGRPNFTWSGVAGESYRIQIAANAAFNAPVVDQAVVATSFRPTTPLATGTTYYWRVHGENTCGNGAWSAVGQFTTRFDPRASIAPGSLAFTQTPGTTGTRTLDVANTGSANLVWSANEANVSGVAPAADAAWQPIGPIGGDVNTVVVSPLDPDVVLAGTAPAVGEGNLYRSADGGATWGIVEANVSVYKIAFATDGTIYAATKTGVRKSTDNGLIWTTPNLNIGTNRQTYGVTAAPSNASIVWAGVASSNGQQTKNLLRSTNAGATWTNVTPAIGAGLNGRAIAVHPTDTNTVVALFDGAFGGGQVWVSTNGGTSWTNRSAGLPNNPLRSVHYDGTRLLVGGGQAYNSQNFGIYQSLDLGVTWTALHTQTPPPRVESIAVDPQNRNTIWLATSDTGIHRSTDGGATWATNLGGMSGIGILDVALVPGDASQILAGALSHGLFRSTDGGGTFAKYGSGISEVRLHSISVNPLDSQELAVAFQSANAGGIYSSTDGGTTWTLEPAPPTRYITVRFAPDGTLYGVSVGPTTIAREALYRRNGDGTWTNIGPNQGANFLVDLQALVFSRNDPDLILTGGKDNGVAGQEGTIWRSADRGQTWTKVFESGVNYKVTSIEIIEDGTDLNMIATHGSATLGNILRSIDGGLTWQTSSTGLDTTGYWALAQTCVHPATPQRVFLAKGNPSTLYRSNDGGESWQAVGTAFTRLVSALACDPIDENVIYVGQGSTLAGTVRVLRSTDAGATFANFDDGIPMAGPQPSAFAFQGSAGLLVATQGGGTYKTSLGGEARACMNPQDVPWLSLTPSGGTTVPGGSTAVTVTANAGTLAFGQYRGQLCFDTNDPNAELIRVPVQLTVANAAQGTVAGKVDAIGQCGVGTSVAANAQVTITGQHNTFNLTTDANGRYSQSIDLAESPLSVRVRKAGYVDDTRSGIALVSAQVTNVDQQVELDAPCLDAAPTRFDVALAAGATATRTLTLDNADGAGTLTWSATDATPQGATPAPTVLAPAVAPGRASTTGGFDLAGYLGGSLPGVTTIDALGGNINCTAGSGLIRHDDGTVESGFGADPSLVQRIMMVDYFVPTTYPAKLDAACFVFVSLGPTSLDFDLVVYDDDGPGGSPGTELGTLPYTATGVPLPPLPPVLPWKGFDLSSLNVRIASGGVYIGVRWFATDPPVTMGADTSAASPGNGGGYRKFDNTPWDPIANAWPQYRSLFIRAVTRDVSGCSAPSDVPWVTLAPTSGSVPARGSADVAVQIDSSGLAAGEHHASLCVTSNDAARPRVIVPVKLTVAAGPNEPGTLNVLGGSGQSASVGTAFAAPLAVQVLNGSGQPLAGVNVDFAAPATGASATLSHTRVTTDANGYATVQAVANANAGSYAVTATVGSLAAAQFALTNLAASIDLAVDVHSVRGHVRRGDIADYLVTVRNVGGDTATGASVSGQLSAQLDAPFAGWVCLGPATSACRETGTGNLADTGLTMPRGGSVSYLVSAPVRWDAEGVAAIAGRSTHASDANPANNDSTDGATVVIHRDGFESRAQAALRRIDETLDVGTAIAFAPTAPADGVVDTLLAAVPRGANLGVDAAVFRVERLNDGDATRLRLVARDADGQAYATAWIRASAASEASITLVAVDTGSVNGDTPAQSRIELHTGAGVVAIPLSGRADGYHLWSVVPTRSVFSR